MMSSMDLTFLGTASAYPSPTRGVSCTALKHEDGSIWLFDCGEGSQIQLMRSLLKASKVNKIFITHLHGDHMFGLPGLMCTVSQNNQKTGQLELYGPHGLRRFIRCSLQLSRSELTYNYVVHELQVVEEQLPAEWNTWTVNHDAEGSLHPNEHPGQQISPDEKGVWNLIEDDRFVVKAVWLKHRIPSFGFCVEEKPTQGKLNDAMLRSMGVPPGPLYGKIKSGETIMSPTGEEVRPEDVLGPPRPGRKVIIMGDTADSSQLMSVGLNADVLVHEATLENELLAQALQNGHSTPEMAAVLGKSLNVGKLVLTHYSQRYKPLGAVTEKDDKSVSVLLEQAEAVLGKGKVICAEDFLTIPIPPRKA
ncbi:zinc phosphodiesterase ELAC protein 1-like [Liolophura sinensis]|uniref:zinc phosphodiesterase ELAC protein 1-like n=1 Tax=Liolophura sinensis TaxID=3198878 RepID=UPI0031586D2B